MYASRDTPRDTGEPDYTTEKMPPAPPLSRPVFSALPAKRMTVRRDNKGRKAWQAYVMLGIGQWRIQREGGRLS